MIKRSRNIVIHSRYGVCGSKGVLRFNGAKRVTAFRLIVVGAVTNDQRTIPINFGYFFTKEVLHDTDIVKTKLDFIKEFYAQAKKFFHHKKIRVAADGLFATVEFFRWASANSVPAIFRMHSNRKVTYKGQEIKINQIQDLMLKVKQKARTIKVMWYDLELFITAERRVSKSRRESIVYLAATYKARPSRYVKDYKKRWPIEKFFRTAKQHLGIQECFSRELNNSITPYCCRLCCLCNNSTPHEKT